MENCLSYKKGPLSDNIIHEVFYQKGSLLLLWLQQEVADTIDEYGISTLRFGFNHAAITSEETSIKFIKQQSSNHSGLDTEVNKKVILMKVTTTTDNCNQQSRRIIKRVYQTLGSAVRKILQSWKPISTDTSTRRNKLSVSIPKGDSMRDEAYISYSTLDIKPARSIRHWYVFTDLRHRWQEKAFSIMQINS